MLYGERPNGGVALGNRRDDGSAMRVRRFAVQTPDAEPLYVAIGSGSPRRRGAASGDGARSGAFAAGAGGARRISVVDPSIDALVVFHDHGHGLFRRWLRWGFRHVFVVLRQDGYWIAFDTRAGLPEMQVVAGADFDLIGYYRRRHGFTVLAIAAPRRRSPSPVMLASCVGAAKRVLGIRATRVLTPYQLYRRLKKNAKAQARVDRVLPNRLRRSQGALRNL